MSLEKMVVETLMRQVVRTPEGRALLLAQTADTEDNGEAAMFDQAEELVDDPRFKKMIARHKADEIEHGRLFRECAERQGVPVRPVPAELKMLDHLDAECGYFFSRPLASIADVVRAFATLQALEERAVVQFAVDEPLFRRYDPQTADVFARVAKDEARHLLYCRAIVRHYARDEKHVGEELARARRAESIAFRKTERATADHIDRLGIITNPIMRTLWRVVSRIETPPKPAFQLMAA